MYFWLKDTIFVYYDFYENMVFCKKIFTRKIIDANLYIIENGVEQLQLVPGYRFL